MPEEALSDLKRALELDPNNGSVKVELAKAKPVSYTHLTLPTQRIV